MAKMLGVDPARKLEALNALQRSFDLTYKMKEIMGQCQSIFEESTVIEATMAYTHLAIWAAACAELGEEKTREMMNHAIGVMYPVFELMLDQEENEENE